MYKPLFELKDLKSVLRSLLVSSKRKLTSRELYYEYRRVEGRPVPFKKFGHATFEDFLQSIPDVCSIDHQKDGTMYLIPILTESLKYIANLVSHQKETTVCNKKKNVRNKYARNLLIPANVQHKLLSFVNCHPQGVPIKVLEKEVLSKLPYLLQGFMNTEEFLDYASHILRLDDGYVYPLYSTYGGDNNRNDENRRLCSGKKTHKENDSDSRMLPDIIINNIKLLMKHYKNGILASEFSLFYEKKFGATFNIQKYGYVNILSVVSAYADVLHCFRVSDEDFLIIETPEDLEENSLENKELKDMITWLIAQFPEGLKADQLAETYEVNFLKSLQLAHFGFDSIDDLLHELETDSLVIIKTVESSRWVYPASDKIQADFDVENEETSEDSGAEYDSILSSYYPPGVLLPPDDVQLQQLPSSSPDATFEVVVSHAVSPSKFWVVLNYDENCLALDQLVDELQSFYNMYNSDYMMPEPTVCVGQYCVCPYKGKWYRARITNISSVSEVQVHLIDIGAVAKKNKIHLRFLIQEFAKLPSQALCCQLAGVPTGQAVWPNKIRQTFVEAVVGRAFTANIINISQNGEHYVELFEEADHRTSLNISEWIEMLETTINSQPEEKGCHVSKPTLQEQLQKFTFI